jgi:predicted nucleic acid-binding protein
MAGSERATSIGLDTSVLLRLLVGSPPDQAKAALRFVKESLAAGARVLVSDLVVAEAYFALHAHYEVPKAEAVSALLEVLQSGLVEPADGAGVLAVLTVASRSAAKPGFVDRLIHDQYRGASATMATFERAASRLPATTVLR